MEPDIHWYIDGKFTASAPMGHVPRIGDEVHWKMFSDSDDSRVFRVVNVRWRRHQVQVWVASAAATDEEKRRD